MEAPAVAVAIHYHDARKQNDMLNRTVASVNMQTVRPGLTLLGLHLLATESPTVAA